MQVLSEPLSIMVKGNNEKRYDTDASFAVLISFISKHFEAIGKNAKKREKNRKKEKKSGTDASFAMSSLFIPKRSNATRKNARKKANRSKRGRERKDKWIKKKKKKKERKRARCWVFERACATMLNRRRYTPAGNVKNLFDDST